MKHFRADQLCEAICSIKVTSALAVPFTCWRRLTTLSAQTKHSVPIQLFSKLNCSNMLAAFALMISSGFAVPLTGQEKGVVDYGKSGYEAIFVPDDVDLLEEKVLPLEAAPMEIGMDMANTHRARGVRLFVTTLKPGQTIKATLKATPMTRYLINWVLPQNRSDLLYSQVKRANENQLTRKAPFISFKNTTPFPYEIAFFISGLADNPYSVKLERK